MLARLPTWFNIVRQQYTTYLRELKDDFVQVVKDAWADKPFINEFPHATIYYPLNDNIRPLSERDLASHLTAETGLFVGAGSLNWTILVAIAMYHVLADPCAWEPLLKECETKSSDSEPRLDVQTYPDHHCL